MDIYSANPNDPQTFRMDVIFEGRLPDYQIKIMGLDEKNILDWWLNFKESNKWKTLSQNCATTAADALKAGGGGDFASWWQLHNIVWTPNDVKKLADTIKTNLRPFRGHGASGTCKEVIFMNKKWQNAIFYFPLIILLAGNCQDVLGNSDGTDNMKDNDRVKFFYEMSKSDKNIFFKNLKLLKIGDSVQKVKATLGEPTYDQMLVGKKGEFVAHALTYYTRILEKGSANEKFDRYIMLLFSSGDTLTKIESNIEGFDEKLEK